MDKVDINKLKKIYKSKVDLKYKAFDHILKMCHTKINTVGLNGINNCWFVIPKLVWGYSIYNLNECCNYIIDKLKEEGFNVEFFYPNVILIQW
jgi:hypothetical protein